MDHFEHLVFAGLYAIEDCGAYAVIPPRKNAKP